MAFLPRRRTPTILGWAGFDGGYKPAVSFAQYPDRNLDDDPVFQAPPPPTFCHDAYGDALPFTVSGTVLCSGCYTKDGVDYSFGRTGINGIFNGAWDGFVWKATVGTISATRYFSGDGTCAGEDVSDTQNAIATIQCIGENEFLVSIDAESAVAGLNLGIFVSASTAGPASPIFNGIAIGDCGFAGANPGGVHSGTVTIDV